MARGPVDGFPWPKKLRARVVEAPDRVHGYSIDDDLAVHYRFTDIVFTGLAGRLPAERESRVFETTCSLLLPASAGEAPAHAASLARLCVAQTSAVFATASVVAAERARFLVEALAPFLAWLERPNGQPPSDFLREPACSATRRLRELLGEDAPALAHPLTREAAAACALTWLGLGAHDHLVGVFAWAHVPLVFAEAMATPARSFAEYPLDLPRFDYLGDKTS